MLSQRLRTDEPELLGLLGENSRRSRRPFEPSRDASLDAAYGFRPSARRLETQVNVVIPMQPDCVHCHVTRSAAHRGDVLETWPNVVRVHRYLFDPDPRHQTGRSRELNAHFGSWSARTELSLHVIDPAI